VTANLYPFTASTMYTRTCRTAVQAEGRTVTIDLGALWTAAGVLAGLQITAFALRVNREVAVGAHGDITWLPLVALAMAR